MLFFEILKVDFFLYFFCILEFFIMYKFLLNCTRIFTIEKKIFLILNSNLMFQNYL